MRQAAFNRKISRLRRYWPGKIVTTIKQIEPLADGHGVSRVHWHTTIQTWLTNGDQVQKEPLELNTVWTEVFTHPNDDDDFDASENLTAEDRDWIAECDKSAERSKESMSKKPLIPASTFFVLLDDKWQCVRVNDKSLT